MNSILNKFYNLHSHLYCKKLLYNLIGNYLLIDIKKEISSMKKPAKNLERKCACAKNVGKNYNLYKNLNTLF